MSLLRSNGISESSGKVWWILAPSLALMPLTASSQSQSLSEVSLTYLQCHGVPCQSVVKVDSTDTLDEVAICQMGANGPCSGWRMKLHSLSRFPSVLQVESRPQRFIPLSLRALAADIPSSRRRGR